MPQADIHRLRGRLPDLARERLALPSGASDDHEAMLGEITRPEIDAKIAAAEARTDTKVKGLEGSVNQLVVKIDGLTQLVQSDISQAKSTRTQIIIAIVAAMLGFYWALYSFVPAEIQKTISAFESGRMTGKAESQATAKGELSSPSTPAPSIPTK